MAPPTWLPPLNSDHQHHIYVKASQSGRAIYDDALFFPEFLIKFKLSVNFYSDNENTDRCFKGLSLEKDLGILCREVAEFSMESMDTISYLLRHMFTIPFDFNNASWTERHLNSTSLDEAKSCCKLSDNENLIEKIWKFLNSMKGKVHNAGKNKFPFKLEMEKKVILPDQELKAWNSWYDEKKISDPNFERDFQEAITRPRTYEELIYQTTLGFRRATKSSIQELEVVKLDDSSSRSSCSICLDELQMGSQGIRLPCSHIFHKPCIVKWLQESHMCPLCRFTLPTVSLVDDNRH